MLSAMWIFLCQSCYQLCDISFVTHVISCVNISFASHVISRVNISLSAMLSAVWLFSQAAWLWQADGRASSARSSISLFSLCHAHHRWLLWQWPASSNSVGPNVKSTIKLWGRNGQAQLMKYPKDMSSENLTFGKPNDLVAFYQNQTCSPARGYVWRIVCCHICQWWWFEAVHQCCLRATWHQWLASCWLAGSVWNMNFTRWCPIVS